MQFHSQADGQDSQSMVASDNRIYQSSLSKQILLFPILERTGCHEDKIYVMEGGRISIREKCTFKQSGRKKQLHLIEYLLQHYHLEVFQKWLHVEIICAISEITLKNESQKVNNFGHVQNIWVRSCGESEHLLH